MSDAADTATDVPAYVLPPDLLKAEADLLKAVKAAVASPDGTRWGATLRFRQTQGHGQQPKILKAQGCSPPSSIR